MITIHVSGTPRAQPRGRVVPAGRGKFRVASVTDKGVKLYIAKVMQACARAKEENPDVVFTGAIDVQLHCYFEVPKRAPALIGTRHTRKPDSDNLQKLFFDAAKKAKLISDDAVISDVDFKKRWARDAGAIFTLTPAPALDQWMDEDPDDIGATELTPPEDPGRVGR